MALSLIQREVTVLRGENCKWKDLTINTGASQPVLQDVHIADSAGGFTYKQTSRASASFSITAQRFITWRSSKSCLELIETSFSHNLTGNALRLHFQDAPIIPSVCIQETHSEVVVMVTTINGVHRLLFPHPSRLQRLNSYNTETPIPSIFADASIMQFRDAINFHEFSNSANQSYDFQCSSAWVATNGETWFGIGTKSGSTILVCLPPIGVQGITQQVEVREASIMQRFWSGIIPGSTRRGQEAPDAPHGVVLHPFGQNLVALTVCRDHKLRGWICKTQDCILSVDLLSLICDGSEGMEEPPLYHHVIRAAHVTDHRKQIFAVFLSLSTDNMFVILEPHFKDGKHSVNLLAIIRAAKEQNIVDFVLTDSDLWVIWGLQTGESAMQHVNYTGYEMNELRPVYMQPLPQNEIEVPPDLEPRAVYLDEIFHPGRFSTNCIAKALYTYSRSVTSGGESTLLVDAGPTILRAEISSVIEKEIQLKVGGGEISQLEYRQLLEQSLARFYSCCVEYQKVANKPLGLLVDVQTTMVGVIQKDTVSVLRSCDHMEHGYILPSALEVNELQTQLLQQGYEETLAEDVKIVFKCLEFLKSVIRSRRYEESLKLFSEREIEEQGEHLAEEILKVSDENSDDFNEFMACLQSIQDPGTCLQVLLNEMDVANGSPEDLLLDEDLPIHTTPDRTFSSMPSRCLIASCFSQIAKSRFDLLHDLLVFESFMHMCDHNLEFSKTFQRDLKESVIPETVTLLQAYLSLLWVSKQPSTAIPSVSLDSNIRQMAALEISESTSSFVSPLSDPDQVTVPTLVHLFLEGVGGDHIRSILRRSREERGPSQELWSSTLMEAVIVLQKLIWPISASFIFPEFLMTSCQFTNLQDYISLLTPWCEWNLSSREFALGHCYLNTGEADKAVKCFKEAVHRVSKEDFLFNKLLRTEELQGKCLETVYFLKVIRLLEQFSVPDLVVEMARHALSVAAEDDPNIPVLWTKIFKYELELGHRDKAYTAVSSNPDPERRRDCLRQYVVVLCERGQAKELIHDPHIDLQDEIVAILESRARSVDLLSNPYYDLLFAFHVVRGNQRQAGAVMYEHATRLAIELTGVKGLQKQAKCYLAALNSLRLVRPEYAWIIKPVAVLAQPKPEDMIGASPKRNYDGDILEPQVTKRQVEVIELDTIEKEYLLVSARLQLANHDPDHSHVTGPPLTADETVSFLAQAGLYDTAIQVCQSFRLPLNPVLESLASKCVRISKEGAQDKTWKWLAANDVGKLHLGKEESPADLAWYLLKSYMNRFQKEGDSSHCKVVASKLLSLGFSLPQWLLDNYKKIDTPSLLNLYMSYDHLEEATNIMIEYIDAVLGNGFEIFGLKNPLHPTSPSVWMPYHLIDNLLKALRGSARDPVLHELHETLNFKMDEYLQKAQSYSEEMINLKRRQQYIRKQ